MYSGQCQCGAIGYQASAEPFVAYTCHCLECQRLSASAFMMCAQFPAEAVAVTQGEPATRSRGTDTGNRLKIWFCRDCGSALFVQNSARPRIRTIFTGTLHEAAAMPVSAHIWLDRALPWFQVPADHRRFARGADWSEDYRSDPDRYAGR